MLMRTFFSFPLSVFSTGVEFNVEELERSENPGWHFISFSWSGASEVVALYVDGIHKETKDLGPPHPMGTSFPGGGVLTLTVRPVPIHLTSFNMWNRELSPDEIAGDAQSCNGANGDAKEWYDFWPLVEPKSDLYVKPSACEPVEIPHAAAAADGGVQGDWYSKGKSIFAKYKKKSPIKSGGKKHHI